MKPTILLFSLGALTCMASANAQAPGTDPIVLEGYQHHIPTGPAVPSGPKGPAVSGRDGNMGTPGSDARLARFQAKIMTLGNDITSTTDGVATNATINSVYDEKRKLCVMDIGSVTTGTDSFSTYGPTGQAAQPVLIRGTVLNICK